MISPLAPESFPVLPSIAGVRIGTLAAGLRYHGRPDVFVAETAAGSTVGAVFTTTKCPSAPVDWCKHLIQQKVEPRAIVCNAGNANAFTGRAGVYTIQETVRAVGALLDVSSTSVFVASTGVIGEPVDDAELVAAIDAVPMTPSGPDSWAAAADAIRTTDTFPKASTQSVADGVNIVGIAKGSGMIAPDMATMLGFIFTDAMMATDALQAATAAAVGKSFNRITVDSDTSTSDSVFVVATGASGVSPGTAEFATALEMVMLDLAHQIVRDGEGATKFIEVRVTGAENERAAELIARSIADSPLVKTALAAEDANWGRIVMAVGKSGEAAERDALRIQIGPELVAANGVVHPDYSEDRATDHLRGANIILTVDVGVGAGSATVWTCDLTHGYIDINAGYRS
ncbi:MAG: bifunctional glutamate N-acetyltransferase/amino-acid acetyltransferase ArgJ [Acidimicrobiales bacterium]|nr:bifunctional glutamate N-acetyltransferase/amino-acid acetyltransferase ArgJ [Acidimicrobiales bacterium]